jgi:hypothetical protein
MAQINPVKNSAVKQILLFFFLLIILTKIIHLETIYFIQ